MVRSVLEQRWREGVLAGGEGLRVAETDGADGRVLLELRWTQRGRARTFRQVLTCRDDRIVHMQDCRSLRRARRLAGLSGPH